MKLYNQTTAVLFALFSLPAMASTVLVDFIGTAYTPAALLPVAAMPNGTVLTFNFDYDVSSAGLGGAANVLRINATSTLGGTRTLTSGGLNGISVQGGNNSWWELGENLQFTVSLRDSGGADVTSFYNLDLTSATMRWGGAGSGTATFGTDTITGPATLLSIDTQPLSVGQTAETSFLATRSAAAVGQIVGLGFEIGASSIPEPSSTALLGLAGIASVLIRRRK